VADLTPITILKYLIYVLIISDNGPQFISSLFEETCTNLKIEHERIPFKTPNKNAHIESFNNIHEHECLACNEFETYAEGIGPCRNLLNL